MTTSANRRSLWCLAFCLGAPVLFAEESGWPRWRGPLATGVAPGAHPPTHWSETENVKWKVAIPGFGTSTPIVWGDCVFLTAQVPHTRELWALCLDRHDGSVRWRKPFGTGFSNRQGNTGASPSAITDGRTLLTLPPAQDHKPAYDGDRGPNTGGMGA